MLLALDSALRGATRGEAELPRADVDAARSRLAARGEVVAQRGAITQRPTRELLSNAEPGLALLARIAGLSVTLAGRAPRPRAAVAAATGGLAADAARTTFLSLVRSPSTHAAPATDSEAPNETRPMMTLRNTTDSKNNPNRARSEAGGCGARLLVCPPR
jgi:hypothetical protein